MKIITVFLITLASISALAQGKNKKQELNKVTPDIQQVFIDCHKSTGVKMIDFKSGEKPKPADMKKMKACLKQKGVIKDNE